MLFVVTILKNTGLSKLILQVRSSLLPREPFTLCHSIIISKTNNERPDIPVVDLSVSK